MQVRFIYIRAPDSLLKISRVGRREAASGILGCSFVFLEAYFNPMRELPLLP